VKRFLKPILISAAVLVLSQAAQALPKVLLWVPSTDMVGAGTMHLEFESDAQKQPFADGYEMYVYSQYGITDRLEVGVDLFDIEHDKDTYFNAKYLVTNESEKLPAIAVGVLDIGKGDDPSYYVVGSRTYDKVRYTFGAEGCKDTAYGLIGLELTLNPQFTFLTDYMSGHNGYSSVGLQYNPTKDLSLKLYYSYSNAKELRADNNYVGFMTSYDFSLGKLY
jgi:opacity protein-like surface antigen